jgi:hypothetical protein
MFRNYSLRAALSTAALAAATVARAAEESGTSAVGEMQVSGATLAMIAGGVGLVGVVVYLVTKVVMK